MRFGHDNAGFTIVEMIVATVLAAVFLAFFIQMFRATSIQQISLSRQGHANNIAFSNLSKFPTKTSITSVGSAYVCDASTSPSTNINNLTINPNAPGTVILNNTSSFRETNTQDLPGIVQEVRAFSPLGCDVPNNNLIKIISKVTYGFIGQQGEAVYATYIQD